jgi:hypothetical protein
VGGIGNLFLSKSIAKVKLLLLETPNIISVSPDDDFEKLEIILIFQGMKRMLFNNQWSHLRVASRQLILFSFIDRIFFPSLFLFSPKMCRSFLFLIILFNFCYLFCTYLSVSALTVM